jgi:hypothetical protein
VVTEATKAFAGKWPNASEINARASPVIYAASIGQVILLGGRSSICSVRGLNTRLARRP